VLYLYMVAVDGYEGHALDALWPASATLIGLAAWQPATRASAKPVEGWTVTGFPALAAALAAVLLVVASTVDLNLAARVLAATALAAALARMALTLSENTRMLVTSRHEALTDGLTGLGNRRKLMLDLERELAEAGEPGGARVLALFDLDGFKQYNDSYGHPAGDALLARLGGALGDAVQRSGTAYRMGGDEFCALLRAPRGTDAALAVQRAARALSERGEGFAVSSSFGSVALPDEASDAIEALQLADRRMYSQKDRRRSSARRQARDVLIKALDERRPELVDHLRDVAELAVAVATHLGVGDQALEDVARAAELHDVGKVAVPDAILDKPGPLAEDEWAFVRQHTLIGERILGAAPALRGAARIVRSSHERWDGTGYPDGLGGVEIPLGARVVAVCDAFDALTSGRPYRAPLDGPAALERLRAGAGSQFDPRAVEALEQELSARPGYEAGSTRSSPRRSSRWPRAKDASSAAADSAI
jgi:diguanylate cyclase (GGDEF)-like protein